MAERSGSTRLIRAVDSGIVAFTYTDFWSVFDRGPSAQSIPGLGAARCACAVKSFELAHKAGLGTHFLEQTDECTIHVQEFSIPDTECLSGGIFGHVLPVEWIWRARAFGSLLERLSDGRITPEELGFPPGATVNRGDKLPEMRLEQTTKFETTDRHLTEAKAKKLCGLSGVDWGASFWEACYDLVKRAVEASNHAYEEAGFLCPDGKLELGARAHGFDGHIPVLVDVFGTPDENRVIDADGKLYCKDLIRDYLKELSWKGWLDACKAAYPNDKSKWPSYPKLPDEVVERVAERYAVVAERYAGVRITY